MTWHARPEGVNAFPTDTAAQWATAWFTPIEQTELNYLVDNLNYLRNPNKLELTTTPGTITTAVPADTFKSVMSGNFTVTGPLYHLIFQADVPPNLLYRTPLKYKSGLRRVLRLQLI